MQRKNVVFFFAWVLSFSLGVNINIRVGFCWSNGGFSDNPANPAYGTHDWIAQHALDWLPSLEKQVILDNIAVYLYGTELPDNGDAPDGIETLKNIMCIILPMVLCKMMLPL